MKKDIEKLLRQHPQPYLTDLELATYLGGTPDSRYGKVKRLLSRKVLLHIRRGLYFIVNKDELHPFVLAQRIYGPSYISLESALSYHQLIPEAVYTHTSVTSRRSKQFETPLGIFSYQHLPLKPLFIEVELVKKNGHTFFIAKPWKAILDYVYCHKKEWNSLGSMLADLRMNVKDLAVLSKQDIELFDEYYHHSRINRFLKAVNKGLKKGIHS